MRNFKFKIRNISFFLPTTRILKSKIIRDNLKLTKDFMINFTQLLTKEFRILGN